VRWVTWTVLVLIVVALGVAVVGAAMERSPGNAVWSDAVVTRAGMFVAEPYPMLLTASEHEGVARAILLVNPGKCGALAEGGYCGPLPGPGEPTREQRLAKLDGTMVEVRGTVLERDGRQMIELAEGAVSIKAAPGEKWREFPREGTEPKWGGHISVRGVVVDSKCYMGAMKPGEGKVHRGCAVRCLLGGVPPVLVSRDAGGKSAYYLMTDSRGGVTNEKWVGIVGDEVDVDGELAMIGDIGVIAVNRARRTDGTGP
jgi:hypothetical protein